jgi:hypothetical protein
MDHGKPRASTPTLPPPATVKPVTSVPLLDVNRATTELRSELLAAVAGVIDSGKFLHGPDVTRLEQSVAQVCGPARGGLYFRQRCTALA